MISHVSNAQCLKSASDFFDCSDGDKTVWVFRAGVSVNTIIGPGTKEIKDELSANGGLSAQAGYDVSIAFQRQLSQARGMYWGMELGVGTRGCRAHDKFSLNEEGVDMKVKAQSYLLTHNIKWSPITLGYRFSLTDNFWLDAHVGWYLSYDFAGKIHEKTTISGLEGGDITDSYSYNVVNSKNNCLDTGAQIGIGVWYKQFNFDVTYQQGISPANDVMDAKDLKRILSTNVMFRVGYAF